MNCKLYYSTLVLSLLFNSGIMAQELLAKHNPKLDVNLSPATNNVINPEKNSRINPKFNWNLNPGKTSNLNPVTNTAINPLNNLDFNPNDNQNINPMYQNTLHPKNPMWKGLYMYDKDDNLVGYLTKATQDVMLCFDVNTEWCGFYVRAEHNIFNHFDMKAQFTGMFICYDSMFGFNEFNKDGQWTGRHIK